MLKQIGSLFSINNEAVRRVTTNQSFKRIRMERIASSIQSLTVLECNFHRTLHFTQAIGINLII